LIGVFFGAELVASHERVHAMVARHLEDVAAGRLRIVIDGEYRLPDAATAHRRAESRSAFGRVVLVP
jgi:NADPH:quinone reductase-like Zn-dependent oxidoreductase